MHVEEKDEFSSSWKPPQRAAFCLPGEVNISGLLQEADIAPIRGKEIRIARASLATEGSEGSNRRQAAHSVSEPDSAAWAGKRAK